MERSRMEDNRELESGDSSNNDMDESDGDSSFALVATMTTVMTASVTTASVGRGRDPSIARGRDSSLCILCAHGNNDRSIVSN